MLARRDASEPASRDGILALLRALHARTQRHGAEISLKMLLPAYERLLRPLGRTQDPDAHMMRELQRVRDIFKSEPDLFNAVKTFDDHVDACLHSNTQGPASDQWVVSDALRLLLALSGGDDGATFVQEDPTHVIDDARGPPAGGVLKQRLGERIQMSNVDIIAQTQHTLFNATALPLAADTVVRHHDFASFTPTSLRGPSLWYPEQRSAGPDGTSISSTGFLEFSDLVPPMDHRSGTIPRLIDIPAFSQEKPHATPVTKSNISHGLLASPSPSGIESEVFFFDASKVIKKIAFDVSDDEASVTEASSKGDDDTQPTESWLTVARDTSRFSSWEDIGGNIFGAGFLPSYTQESNASRLRQPVPLSLCRASPLVSFVEVDEADAVHSSTKALCGIESVIFRRDVTTASLQLSRRVLVKLATASSRSLASVLEEIRVAGTAFMRVEFLSIYYSQDPSRGGRTAQALADSLQVFLSAYQEIVCEMSKSVSRASCLVSLIRVLAKTRSIRHKIVELSRALTGSVSESAFDYWGLLTGGDFPRGVALLDVLHKELRQWEREDATGAMASLWRWLLVRAAVPFLAVLSSYLASGQTTIDLDPFAEFQLSVYSTLQGFTDLASSAQWMADIVPRFLQGSSVQVAEIGPLQQILCSILPETEMIPLQGLVLCLRVNEAQVRLDRIRELVLELGRRIELACTNERSSLMSRQSLRSPAKSTRADSDADSERVTSKRKRLEHKPGAQKAQREMLDEMVTDRYEGQLSQAESEPLANTQMESSQMAREANQVQRGKTLLLAKYTPLISDADDQLRYMKWRRDRSIRLSTSKQGLTHLYESDREEWATAQCEPSLDDQAVEITSTPAVQSTPSVQESDAIMDETGVEVPLDCPHAAATIVDALGDDGLMWRPRIRALNVPGGGGEDAAAALYPDRWSAQKKPATLGFLAQRSSVSIARVNHADGSAAYDTIYGQSQADTHSPRQDVIVARKEGDTTCSGDITTGIADDIDMRVALEEPATTSADLDTVMAVQDTQVESSDTGAAFSSKYVTSAADSDAESKHGNPILPILHPATKFLHSDTSADDLGLLNSILYTNSSSSPTPSYPFQTLTKLSLEDPIALIHEFIDRMAVKAIVVKLKLKQHLLWLHRVALMSEGLGMAIFSRDLYSQLRSDQRLLLALPGRVTTTLALALIEARAVNNLSQLPRFEYRIENSFPTAISTGSSIPSMVDVVQHITLTYDITSQLGVVLTPQTTSHYQRVHQFLLLIRLTEHEAKETWLSWRKSPLRHDTQSAATRRGCDLALFSAQLLLNAFVETFTNEVLGSKWAKLMGAVDNAKSVSTLRSAHEIFSSEAYSCCFLQESQLETLQTFHVLIESVWSLGRMILAAERHGDSMDPFHSKLCEVVQGQAAAMSSLSTQLDRLESSHDRGLRDFAKHLILRLNLNGFFSDKTLTTSHN